MPRKRHLILSSSRQRGRPRAGVGQTDDLLDEERLQSALRISVGGIVPAVDQLAPVLAEIVEPTPVDPVIEAHAMALAHQRAHTDPGRGTHINPLTIRFDYQSLRAS